MSAKYGETKSLFRAVSVLVSVISVFILLCLLTGLALGEGMAAVRAFALPSALGALLFALSFLVVTERVVLSSRFGYLFVVLSWVSASVIGALPYIFSGCIPSFIDALFESMSGFTTTGATILTEIEGLPRSLLLWRATTHWLGGMGIVVLTVAIFPLLGISGRALMEAEAPGPQVDKFTPRLSQTASILWLVYLGLTVALVVLLMFGGMDLIDAITHSFATMATGGFSTKNVSVGSFGSAYIDAVITVFMVLAGSNFALHWKLLHGDFRSLFRDSEWKAYIGVFTLASLLVTLNLRSSGAYEGLLHSFRFASFQVASILTTTGFGTADYLQWPFFSQAVLFAVMFIGGCSGSTGGGIKVGRILTLVKMGFAEMKYMVNPRGVYGIFMNRQYMNKKIVYNIAAMVWLYLCTIIISTLVVAWGGYDIMTSLSATLATLGNIGPGFSLVGPMFNYAFFPDWIKLWLYVMMLVGRLEVFTVFVIFTKAFWKR